MLYLISNSKSRVNLLTQAKIPFVQVNFNFDENLEKKYSAILYVQKVALEKERQFLNKKNKDFEDKTLLFADSIVCIGEEILTKAKNDGEAEKMLILQSGNSASIISAFILTNTRKRIFSISKTTLFFKEFEKGDLKNYIQSGLYKDKAGGIMCEGFHKKYILKRFGNLNTALGLDTNTLKAYL